MPFEYMYPTSCPLSPSGHRSCLWGTACDGVEEKSRLDVYGIIFCCHGDNQYVHSTHFGPGNVVCRCHGSAVPKHDQQRHAPPTTMNALSSGKDTDGKRHSNVLLQRGIKCGVKRVRHISGNSNAYKLWTPGQRCTKQNWAPPNLVETSHEV